MPKYRSAPLTLICLALSALVVALPVDGQSGWSSLVFVEFHQHGAGGVSGLSRPVEVALSPGGEHAYVAAVRSDSVAVFSRDSTTGALTFVEAEKEGVNGAAGLESVLSVAVSPDGSHVYTVGGDDDYDAVSTFARDPVTGALTFAGILLGGATGIPEFRAPDTVRISPDGSYVYVTASYSDSVVFFSRNPSTGALTFSGYVKNGTGGVAGLDRPLGMAMSPDGSHVYVSAQLDKAIVAFSRSPTSGALSFVEAERDGVGGVHGLDGSWAVAVSPDGNHVYGVGENSHDVAQFRIDSATGALAFMGTAHIGFLSSFSATSITVSVDGYNAYVPSGGSHFAVFTRDPSRGMLTYERSMQDGQGGIDGIDGANSIAVSSDGDHVYVTGGLDNAVALFESRGPRAREAAPGFLRSWGSSAPGDAQLLSPRGLAVGSVFVGDYENDRIKKFDTAGNLLTEWGSQGSGDGQLNGPLDMAVGPLGNLHVVDVGNHRIQVFDKDGTFLRKWGSEGSAAGQFNIASGISVDASSNVYVVDRGNFRVQKFDRNGVFLTEWGSEGTGPGQFTAPMGVAVGPFGDVYVTDGIRVPPEPNRVQRFDSVGNLLGAWGSGPSDKNGRFDKPGRPAVDREGNVYVPDVVNHRIEKFDRYGNFLVAWGTAGAGVGEFGKVKAVGIDELGRIYVADTENNCVHVFGGPYFDLYIGDAQAPLPTLWLARPSISDKLR
jgi:DNA-binding beta-propeller fold protein YncE